MQSNKIQKLKELFEQNQGKKVLLTKKKNKDYIIAGIVSEVFDDSLILKSAKDNHFINLDEVYSADIKSHNA